MILRRSHTIRINLGPICFDMEMDDLLTRTSRFQSKSLPQEQIRSLQHLIHKNLNRP